jgi:hypothetical protein
MDIGFIIFLISILIVCFCLVILSFMNSTKNVELEERIKFLEKQLNKSRLKK